MGEGPLVGQALLPSSASDGERSAQLAKARSLPVTGEFAPLAETGALPSLPAPGEPREGPPFVPDPPEAAARWEAAIADFEREARALGGDPRAAQLYLEIGRIYEEHLARPRNAATSYQRAFNLNPRDPAVLHASRRLFTEVANWSMVVQILGYEIECAELPERRATLLAEKGTLLAEKLKNAEEAQKAFAAALEAWAAEPLALDALVRSLSARREHAAMAEVYARALEVTTHPRRRLPLLQEAARLAEDHLQGPALAIAYHQEVLQIEGQSAPALEALRRLTAATGRWQEHVEVLRRGAEQAGSAPVAAQLLLAAARVQHEKLDAPDVALQTLLEALEHDPADLAILREIEQLYAENERHDEVVKVLRRELEVTTEPRDRVPMLYKLGCLLEDRLGSVEEAIAAFEEAVASMPAYVPAKQALGRLYEKTERFAALAELFEMEIRLEEDAGGKVGKLYKLAELRELRLGQAEEAVATLRALLAVEPDHQPARKYLERLLSAREAWPELVTLYEEEVGLARDRDQRVFLLGRVAVLAEEKLGDLERAARAYEQILGLAPGHLHAIRSLATLAARREDWASLLRLYELEAGATEDPAEIVALQHRAGVITEEKLGDVDGAMVRYEQVLSLSPSYLPALRSLGRLYHQRGRWEELVTMYQREVDVARSPDQAVGLLFRMAGIVVEHLADEGRAAALYERILALDPQSLPALRALAEIHARRGDDEALVDVLRREAESTREPAERARILMRVAEICEARLGRADRAAEMYQEVLRSGGQFDPALRALVRIYSAEGLWNALGRALEAAYAHAADDAARAALLVRSAEVAGDKLGELDMAADLLERAHGLQPDDVDILGRLEQVSVARGDWRRAVAAAKALAQHESDPRLYAARQIRIAVMLETRLEPPESGAEHHRLALETVPDHPVALRALELAYIRSGHWEGLAALYHREALVTTAPAQKTNLLLRAADIAESRLQRAEYAGELFAKALEVSPASLPALAGRRRIAERLGDPQAALESVQRQAELTADAAHAVELFFEAGRLSRDQLGDTPGAVRIWEEVLSRSPGHLGAFNRLEAVYLEQEAWAPMLQLLVRRAGALEDREDQAGLLAAAGQLAQDRLADPARAAELYREVLAINRMHPIALVRLGPLLFAIQDWDGAVDVFHRTLAVSKEPQVLLTSFKCLGIIYQEHRQDLVKCVQSFQAALQADPADTECLRRLAEVYRGAQDWNSAVNVLLRLAEVEPHPRAKVETLLELAQIYETGVQDRASAILANKKVLEIDPGNQKAILRLTELFEEEQDWQSLAEATSAYVRLLPSDQKGRAAPLHLKMADVFEHKIGDDQRAINALKFALEAQPENGPALERLASLYAKNPETHPQAVDAHRRLLKLNPFRVQSYHEMHRMFLRRGEHDKAFVVAEILVFLRAQHQDEDLYYHEHKAKVAPHAAGALGDQEHERWVTHPGERGPLRAALEILGSELAKVYPGDLSRYELKSADRHNQRSALPLRKLADELAHVLGAPAFDLWITSRFDLGLFSENERPLALVVGANVGRRIQDKDQRFLIARQLERMKGGHHLLDLVPAKDLEVLLWAVAKLGNPSGSVPVDLASLEAMQRTLSKAVSSKARRALEEAGRGISSAHVDVVRHRKAAQHTANRAGLVVTNDVEVAVRNIAREHPDVRPVFADAQGAQESLGKVPEIRELLSYAVSEEYFAARAKLGFSIQS